MTYIEPGDKIIYKRYAGDNLPMNAPNGYLQFAQLMSNSQGYWYAEDTEYPLKYNAVSLKAWIYQNSSTVNKTLVAYKWKAENGDEIYFHLARNANDYELQAYLENVTQHEQLYNITHHIGQFLNKIISVAEDKDESKIYCFFWFGRLPRSIASTDEQWKQCLSFIGWSQFNDGVVDDEITGFNALSESWGYTVADSTGSTVEALRVAAFKGIKKEDEDPNNTDPAEPSGPADPFPEYLDDDILLPDLPTDSALNSDFLRCYHLDSTGLTALAADLWSNNFFSNIIKNYDSPFENIISLNILPVSVTGSSALIRIGNYETNVYGDAVTSQFIDLDGGSIFIDKLRDNQLDFEPARTAQIYLPFIGYRQIDLDDLSGGYLHLTYRLDILTGNLMAMLRVEQDPSIGGRYAHNSVEYFFNGNCATSVPVSGSNYATQYANMLNGAMSASTGLLGVSGGITGAMGGASSIMNSKPQYQRSGQLSGNAGFMGVMTAFVLLSSPIPHIPANARQLMGYRSMIYRSFENLTGYEQIESHHPSADLAKECTKEELDEIERLLKEGVIF